MLRRFLGSGLLVVLGLAGGLILAEGVAAIFWQAPWYERLLAEQVSAQRYPHKLNRHGLRGPEIEVPKPAGQRRVLVIGDSFTFGLGIERDDVPFPSVLARLLSQSGISDVDVVNGGIPGSLTGDWGALWRRAGAEIDPDLVLVVFFLRDGTRLETIPQFFSQIRNEVAKRNETSRLYQRSKLYRWVRDLRDRSRIGEAYSHGLTDAYLGGPKQTGEWSRARRNLLDLRDMAEAHGARFALAIFPVLVDLDADYPFREVTELLLRFAEVNDIPSHDLLPAFEGWNAPDLWVSPLDQHPNAQGHALAAGSLLPFVRELLDSRPEAAVSPARS